MRPTMRDTKHSRSLIIKSTKKLRVINHDGDSTSNTGPYGVSSPFSLPPFESLAPYPLPENAPPYCIFPPFTPQVPEAPPSTTIPPPEGFTPVLPNPSPPGPFPTPSPPQSFVPSPPEAVPSPYIYIPSPPGPVLSPPHYEPSPPSGFTPSPPTYVPSPPGFVPSPLPPVFLPPIVFPPPIVPPSPKRSPNIALWCVAKPSVPDPIIEEAMNYACGSGADCDTIQSNGPCFEPNTVYAHASYAFNSYWQRTKVAGGTCSFGGTAMLVTVDPSKFQPSPLFLFPNKTS